MTRARWLVAPALVAACAAPLDARDAVRTDDELVVRAADRVVAVARTRAPDAITVEIGEAGGAPEITGVLAPGALGWAAPGGELAGLRLATQAGGAPAWIGALGGASYRLWLADERGALAAALDAAGLGAPLRAILPYHRRARAWLPESRALFAVAALADPTTTGDPASWPALAIEDDLPGQLPGDVTGLGMTCSTAIRCPAEAPICVTADHDDARGFCTRACLAADECDGAHGRCGLAVTDIPGVPGGVTACYLPCAPDGSCPALLACSAGFGAEPAVCAPP